MSAFLLYIARSGLYLSIFYIFYLLLMRRTTFFGLNRIVLILATAVCAFLPLLKLRTVPSAASAGALAITGTEAPVLETMPEGGFPWVPLLTFVYCTGALAIVLNTFFSFRRMLLGIKSGQRTQVDGIKTVVLDDDRQSFSFGNTVVIGRKDLGENPAVFLHEAIHVKKCHALDLLFFRLIQIIWWWNPLVWIIRTELGLLHEYEADEGVLESGVDAGQYQMLLVRKAVGDDRFVLASGFQYSKLKNRINMMLRPHSAGGLRWSYLLVIPFIAIVAYACNPVKSSGPESEGITDDTTYPEQAVDVKPTFNGGDADEFSKWFNKRLLYPESAHDLGIQGKVLLSFTVDTDGSVIDAKVLRGAHPVLDAEALRVIESCKEKWTPGMMGGKPVRVKYIFPVIFQLR